MTTLQNDEMLECLKTTNGYASRNIFKRCHNMTNGAPNSRIKHFYLYFPWARSYTPISNASINSKTSTSDSEWMMTKVDIL